MEEKRNVHFKPRAWLVRAVALAGSPGLVHFLARPLYFGQWLGYGVFSFTVAVLQVMYSMVLAVSSLNRAVLWLGIVGNSLVVITWAMTHTIGIPFFGPMAGVVLPLGLLDGVAQLLATIQIVHLAVLLREFDRLGARPLVE